MTDCSDLVPPSRAAQNALVRANCGVADITATRDDLIARQLLTEGGEITDLGVQVATHIVWVTWKHEKDTA